MKPPVPELLTIVAMSHSGSRGAFFLNDVYLDENNFVNGETPVEDYGMWFVVPKGCKLESESAASRVVLALVAHKEGEEPVEGSMSESDRLFRSHLLPVLLEKEEMEIYKKLTQ